MRSNLALGLLALGILMLPTLATATCAPLCNTTTAGSRVFVPNVMFLTSGSTASWTSGDGAGHTASADDFCFNTGSFTSIPRSVLFTIVSGALLARDSRGIDRPCGAVEALPDGSVVVGYDCLFHPEMKGTIVVR